MLNIETRGRDFSFVAQETQDAAMHEAISTGWDGSVDPVAGEHFRGQLTQLALNSIQIVRERTNQAFTYRGHAGPKSLLVISLAPTEGRLTFGGSVVAPQTLAAFRWDFSDRIFCSGPMEGIFVSVDEDILLKHADKMQVHDLSRSSIRNRSVRDPEIARQFYSGAEAILQQVAGEPDALFSEHERARLTDNLLELLVRGFSEASQGEGRVPRCSTRAYVVDKAIDYIDAHLSDAIAMSDLCDWVRVSQRTLRYSFEEILGVSPIRYLLARRLSMVRRDLLAERPEAAVHCIAQRYGFTHMGRFGRQYRDAYGELPSKTSTHVKLRKPHSL